MNDNYDAGYENCINSLINDIYDFQDENKELRSLIFDFWKFVTSSAVSFCTDFCEYKNICYKPIKTDSNTWKCYCVWREKMYQKLLDCGFTDAELF